MRESRKSLFKHNNIQPFRKYIKTVEIEYLIVVPLLSISKRFVVPVLNY